MTHIGLRTTNPVRDEGFWTQVMNARVSDRIGQVPCQFPFEPGSFCMWGSRPEIAEFRGNSESGAKAA